MVTPGTTRGTIIATLSQGISQDIAFIVQHTSRDFTDLLRSRHIGRFTGPLRSHPIGRFIDPLRSRRIGRFTGLSGSRRIGHFSQAMRTGVHVRYGARARC
jgi:hypothetical protein